MSTRSCPSCLPVSMATSSTGTSGCWWRKGKIKKEEEKKDRRRRRKERVAEEINKKQIKIMRGRTVFTLKDDVC